MKFKPLFPNVPEDVSSLSDDELAKLISEGEAALEKVEQGDTDGRSQAELYEEVKAGVEGLERARSEQEARATAAEENAAKLQELIARGRGTASADDEDESDEDEDESTDEADDDTDDEAEPLAADGARIEVGGDRLIEEAQRKAKKFRVGRPSDEHRPVAAQVTVPLTASADVPGVPMGAPFETGLDLAKAFKERFNNLGKGNVEGEKVPVARARWQYPDDRRLSEGMSEMAVVERINKAVGGAPKGRANIQAVTASGGLCAPVEIRYDLPVLAQADRPVRDSLTNFNATRGGIRFAPPPGLSSITTGVGRITAAADAAGGSGAQKGCQVIACPTFQEVDVAAIYHCIQFGNLGARAYPELVENATELVMAAWARVAETALLDGMVAASTHATVNLTPNSSTPLGAVATLLPALLRNAAALRNRQRMDPEAPLDVQLPAWTLDLLLSDIVRSAFDRFSEQDADFEAIMASYGLRPTFYWDGPTGSSQVFGAQTNNATLLEFPPTIEYFMYPSGSFLFLDSGELDLGLVRDSVLNKTNDYQMFGESWENLAFIGLESDHVTANVCDTGAVAAAVQSVCGS